MPWRYINKLLGPGSHWGRTQQELLDAIAQAEADNMTAAAGHIRIILALRNKVLFETPAQKTPGTEAG
jgi:hypothetical protein